MNEKDDDRLGELLRNAASSESIVPTAADLPDRVRSRHRQIRRRRRIAGSIAAVMVVCVGSMTAWNVRIHRDTLSVAAPTVSTSAAMQESSQNDELRSVQAELDSLGRRARLLRGATRQRPTIAEMRMELAALESSESALGVAQLIQVRREGDAARLLAAAELVSDKKDIAPGLLAAAANAYADTAAGKLAAQRIAATP